MKFIKEPRAIAAVTIIGVVLVFATYSILSTPGPMTGLVPSKFTVNGRMFSFTYIATDQASREQGLMNRKVTNTTTMLFVFPSAGIYNFWMYDTNTSLDMIWIHTSGESGQVVYVHADSQPCYSSLTCSSFGPPSPANYVIEARAGFAKTNRIIVGTTIEFEAPTTLQVS